MQLGNQQYLTLNLFRLTCCCANVQLNLGPLITGSVRHGWNGAVGVNLDALLGWKSQHPFKAANGTAKSSTFFLQEYLGWVASTRNVGCFMLHYFICLVIKHVVFWKPADKIRLTSLDCQCTLPAIIKVKVEQTNEGQSTDMAFSISLSVSQILFCRVGILFCALKRQEESPWTPSHFVYPVSFFSCQITDYDIYDISRETNWTCISQVGLPNMDTFLGGKILIIRQRLSMLVIQEKNKSM